MPRIITPAEHSFREMSRLIWLLRVRHVISFHGFWSPEYSAFAPSHTLLAQPVTHASYQSLTYSLTIYSPTHPLTHSLPHSLTYSLTTSITISLTHSLIHSPSIHPPTHPPTHSLTHSLTHLFTHYLNHFITHLPLGQVHSGWRQAIVRQPG